MECGGAKDGGEVGQHQRSAEDLPLVSSSPWRVGFHHRALPSQVSPHQSAGAGTPLTGWHLCPSVARYTSGSTVMLTPGSPSTRRPTRSSQTSASSGGTPTKKASWCLDTRMAACPFFSQVCVCSVHQLFKHFHRFHDAIFLSNAESDCIMLSRQ